jgi:hypothetical protein
MWSSHRYGYVAVERKATIKAYTVKAKVVPVLN